VINQGKSIAQTYTSDNNHNVEVEQYSICFEIPIYQIRRKKLEDKVY